MSECVKDLGGSGPVSDMASVPADGKEKSMSIGGVIATAVVYNDGAVRFSDSSIPDDRVVTGMVTGVTYWSWLNPS